MPTETTDGRREALRSVIPVASAHAGLWLDRFLNRAAGDAPVRDLIDSVLRVIRRPDGYDRAFARREAALQSGELGLDGGFDGGATRFWTATTQGRMVVGIGAASVRETAISLLRTWGIPFLPGSALKGVAAAMARRSRGEWAANTAGYRTLFGDHQHGGCVVFHDAWWDPANHGALPLDLDVMTVHHAGYYRGDNEAPCDWDDPNPVPFVTASGAYLVALSGPVRWVEAAGALLANGLAELGIGAKTAAGYGRMTLVHKPTQREAERRTKAAPLINIGARFKGASNANDLVRLILRVQGEGAEPADIRTAAVELWRRDPRFWRSWVKNATRTEAERQLIGPYLDDDAGKAPG